MFRVSDRQEGDDAPSRGMWRTRLSKADVGRVSLRVEVQLVGFDLVQTGQAEVLVCRRKVEFEWGTRAGVWMFPEGVPARG